MKHLYSRVIQNINYQTKIINIIIKTIIITYIFNLNNKKEVKINTYEIPL